MLNALGLYLLWSLGFVVGAFIEFAVVVLLSQPDLTIRKKVGRTVMPMEEIYGINGLRRRKVNVKEKSDIERANKDATNQAEKALSLIHI